MNTKKAITLLVLATLLFSMVPLVSVNAAIGNIDHQEVADKQVGDTITVIGDGVTAGATVQIYWDSVSAWDGEDGLLNTTEAESNGSFEVNFDVPDAVAGDHYVWAKDVSTGATEYDATALTVVPSIEIDPDQVLVGDEVTITGKGYAAEDEIITIQYANITWYNLTTSPATPETDELGTWTATFDIPDLADGAHNIHATDNSTNDVNGTYTIGPQLTLDVENGPEGTVVSITGRGFTDDEEITTADVKFNTQLMTVTEEDTVSNEGDFTVKAVVPSLGAGTYDITVNDGTATSDIEFEIDEDGEADTSVDPTFGVQGSTIVVTGANFTQISGETISIELYNEAGDTQVVEIDEAETESDGTFTATVTVLAQSNGKYTIYAIDDTNKVNASTSFKIGSIIVILSKNEGPSGKEIILTGTGFEAAADWNATLDDEVLIEDIVDGDGNLEEGGGVPKFYVPSLDTGVYTLLVMDDEANEVEVEFEVTDTTSLVTDPLVAPNDYNVTIEGMYFTQDAGNALEFKLWNSTEDWDMVVEYGGVAVEVDNGDDEGEFTGYWEVPDSDTLDQGTYTINCTDDTGLLGQYEFELVDKTVEIEPKKASFAISDTVAFDVESSFSKDKSYIKVYDPADNLYWQTDTFPDGTGLGENDVWITVGTIERVPYYEQVAGGNPMTLQDDAPLGEWFWAWYDVDDEQIDNGTFAVTAAEADVVADQVADLNEEILDLADQLTDVSAEFGDVQSDIADVAAVAQQAVDAATAASEAVTAVATTANTASQAAENAAEAANAAKDAASGLTTLVYGAIGAALVSLMQISRRIAG